MTELIGLSGWPLTVLAVLLALLLDLWLGEPRRYHPLVGFGWLASRAERWLHGGENAQKWNQRFRGLIAMSLIVFSISLAGLLVNQNSILGFCISILILYSAIGHRSLRDHVLPVARSLEAGDEAGARQQAAMIVSRDPATMDVPRSTIESALENGCDGIFGALFWFLLAGVPGVLCYRLVNTLDAMWGYRSPRYLHFGWAAAKLDDLLNYLPARLTAISYALLGDSLLALQCWQNQAPYCSSPNGGPVMASGAGALQLSLGGPTRYRGEWLDKPVLGAGEAPRPRDIRRAMALVSGTVALWLVLLALSVVIGLNLGGFAHA